MKIISETTLQMVEVALFRCMFDVIFVTHKSMMTIPIPIVTKPPWYAAIPDLLCVLAVPVFINI